MSITVTNLTKDFGRTAALRGLSLHIPDGELVALLGPSGSGKTTLLRIIAGLDKPDSGTVAIDGVDVTSTDLRSRGIGFVFQHYALFRHLSVAENIAFGLECRPRATRPSKDVIAAKVRDLLALVRLNDLGNRLPSQLSGGQRQRVALARALAVEPKVLLLDEPFGALDAKVRLELRRWLRRLHDEVHVTSVFVTHDQDEALEVADRVVVINQGAVEQEGSSDEVYRHPKTAFVHQFLGNVNVFHGRIQAHDEAAPTPAGSVTYVRPHDIELGRIAQGVCTVPAVVKEISAVGALVRIELERSDDGQRVEAQITRARHDELRLTRGESVYLGFTEYRTYAQKANGAADYQI
jgi:sulfate transport system ATP-binding protein